MTDKKKGAFEDILLDMAALCHSETRATFKAMRKFEGMFEEKAIGAMDMIHHCQRELGNVHGLVDDVTKLARTAALFRGQRIFVTHMEGEGGESRSSIPQEKFAAPELLEAAE